MLITIDGIDISDAPVQEVRLADRFGGEPDALFLTVDRNDLPETDVSADSVIEIEDGGTRFGRFYICDADGFGSFADITALSIRQRGRVKDRAVYHDLTISELADAVAKECGCGYSIYGVDPDTYLKRAVRRNETPIAFLSRIMGYENALTKVTDSVIRIISRDAAESGDAIRRYDITDRNGDRNNEARGRIRARDRGFAERHGRRLQRQCAGRHREIRFGS